MVKQIHHQVEVIGLDRDPAILESARITRNRAILSRLNIIFNKLLGDSSQPLAKAGEEAVFGMLMFIKL
jgi:hypothetical protein